MSTFCNCLKHFPQVRELFWFLDDEVDLELLLGPLCLRNQLLVKSFTTEILYFDFCFLIFLTFSVLPWAVILYFGKPRHQTWWSWLEGSVLRYTTEVHDWGKRMTPCVTSFRVNYLPYTVQVSTSWCEAILWIMYVII